MKERSSLGSLTSFCYLAAFFLLLPAVTGFGLIRPATCDRYELVHPNAIHGNGDYLRGGNTWPGHAHAIRRCRLRAIMVTQKSLKRSQSLLAVESDSDTKEVSTATNSSQPQRRLRKRYIRRLPKTESEQANILLKSKLQAEYEQIRKNSPPDSPPSVWSFESLFPQPVFDEDTVYRDLYEVTERDGNVLKRLDPKNILLQYDGASDADIPRDAKLRMKRASSGGASRIRIPKLNTPNDLPNMQGAQEYTVEGSPAFEASSSAVAINGANGERARQSEAAELAKYVEQNIREAKKEGRIFPSDLEDLDLGRGSSTNKTVDVALTRMVEDRVYGYRRGIAGDFFDASPIEEGAVQFRDGRRVGNALGLNNDLLTFHAKKELARGHLEEAQELYEKAVDMDPRDGRGYLGLARVAKRRRDFKYARKCLRTGIENSLSSYKQDGNTVYDWGGNPFLLQALGSLEEEVGHLSEAEALYLAATKSRPSHAASWVSLGQLRTKKLRQSAKAGRSCFQKAEMELKAAGLPQSSYVYTAWASLEHKKAGNARRARELFVKALRVDPRCSAAWLQLGMMEAEKENWERAENCFEKVLEYDRRNSRVIQAYALMESRRPDGDSRKALGLFERALKVRPRDGAVLQAFGLYVAKLGDIDAARDLLRRGTKVNKRHAPLWQAWGVLETRHGSAEEARDIFQQGIWNCAQLGGGQSGGYGCARLWQAWGVLETREGDYAAARRCFGRALDADRRNVAVITAWAKMEEQIGNTQDSRAIFERALKEFPSNSDERMTLWRAYELMEERAGNFQAAQQIYQRSMREAIATKDTQDELTPEEQQMVEPPKENFAIKETIAEFEVLQWKSEGSMDGEVWLNDGSLEGKVPKSVMKNTKPKKQKEHDDFTEVHE